MKQQLKTLHYQLSKKIDQLEEMHQQQTETYNSRSEAWQDSAPGDYFFDRLEDIGDVIYQCKDLQQNLQQVLEDHYGERF